MLVAFPDRNFTQLLHICLQVTRYNAQWLLQQEEEAIYGSHMSPACNNLQTSYAYIYIDLMNMMFLFLMDGVNNSTPHSWRSIKQSSEFQVEQNVNQQLHSDVLNGNK